MSKETKNSKNSTEQETKQARQLIRRRLVGALIVFTVAFVLWQIGDELPPQPVFRDVPEAPDDLLTDTEHDGDADTAVFVETAEGIAAEAPPAATVVTAETTKTDKVRISTIARVIPSAIEKTDSILEKDSKPIKSEEAQKPKEAAQVEKSEKVVEAEKAEETEKPKKAAVVDNSASSLRFQAGAFKDAKNAEVLAKELAAQDLSTQVEIAGGWHRLYVVDLPDAAALTAAKAAVKRLVAARQTTEKTSAEEQPAEKFILQVGAFGQGERSRRIAGKLEEAGFTVQLKPVDKNGEKLTRVRVFVSGRRADAEAARARLIQLGYEQTNIID